MCVINSTAVCTYVFNLKVLHLQRDKYNVCQYSCVHLFTSKLNMVINPTNFCCHQLDCH